MTESTKALSGKIKLVIAILVTLIIFSAGALAVRIIYLNYFARNTSTVVVPDNLIDDQTASVVKLHPLESLFVTVAEAAETGTVRAATVELYKGKPSDNEKFEVKNMLPGDTEVKYFQLKVYHDGKVRVYFGADVTEQTKSLGDVLNVKVTHLDTDVVVYDGPFNAMNVAGYGEDFPGVSNNETTAYYEIKVSLPSSVGNEHQAAMLKANFKWYVKEEISVTEPPATTAPPTTEPPVTTAPPTTEPPVTTAPPVTKPPVTDPGKTSRPAVTQKPDDYGTLVVPETGDATNIVLWAILISSSLSLIVILLYVRRREEEDDHAEQI